MYPRTDYEMTQADLDTLLSAMKSVPYMVIGGSTGPSQQERANNAWADLGQRMGFDSTTVQPIAGKGNRFFSAVPSENEAQRAERETSETEAKRKARMVEISHEIEERQRELDRLCAAANVRELSTG